MLLPLTQLVHLPNSSHSARRCDSGKLKHMQIAWPSNGPALCRALLIRPVSASMAGDILPSEDGRTERNSRAKRVVSEFISNNYVAINKQMTAIKLQSSCVKCSNRQPPAVNSTRECVLHYSGNISHTYASRNALHALPFIAGWLIFQ